MYPRRMLLGAALFLAASGLGCRVLDRESYSLVIRKKAHQYEPPPKDAPPEADEKSDPPATSMPDPSPHVRHDLDELIENAAPSLDPFRPFAYCSLHGSSHPIESLFAYVLAPVDYPVGLSTQFTYMAIETTIQTILALPQVLLGPPDPPLKMEERPKRSK